MSLRDEVEQNLGKAQKETKIRRQEELAQVADTVYQAIRNYIVAMSGNHTGSAPFRVDICLVCNKNSLDRKEGVWERGLFQQSTQVNTLFLNQDVAMQIAMIKEKLKEEGVGMTDLRFDGNFVLDEDWDITPKTALCYPFSLYKAQRHPTTKPAVALDPTKPITEKVVQDKGFGVRCHTTFTQGKQQYSAEQMRDQALCMLITYPGELLWKV